MERKMKQKDDLMAQKESRIDNLYNKLEAQKAQIEAQRKEFDDKKLKQANEVMKDSLIFNL